MTSKQKLPVLATLGAILILAALAVLLFYFKKPSAFSNVINKENRSGQNENQTSQPAQNFNAGQNSTPMPLASNLPAGVAADALPPVEGKSGSAKVIALSDGKTFSLALEAKLTDAPQGQFYTAWLAKSGDDKNPLKLDKLQKDNDVYTLSFGQDGDFSAYKIAIVSLETKDDNILETKILEGTL
jgi:hypothetical protein